MSPLETHRYEQVSPLLLPHLVRAFHFYSLHLPHSLVFALLTSYTESLQHIHSLSGLPIFSETVAYLTISD